MNKVILWGTGKHANEIVDKYVIPNNFFEMVVDRNYKVKDPFWRGYKVQPPEQIGNAKSELVLIGTKLYINEISEHIRKVYPDKKAVYIDEYFEELYPEKDLSEKAINHSWQLFGGLSYAQHGDDLIVMNLFNNLEMTKFTYLDIGAHNPYIISNTALFYKRGCRGINVEANPNLIQYFYEYRPEDSNLNIGIGKKQGTMPFYMIDQLSGLNSFSEETIKKRIDNKKHDIKVETINIPVITLELLIKNYCNGVFPDFLSIDIEGLDYDVLSSIDLNRNGPLIIDVEIMGDIGLKMKNMLEEQGYKIAFRCGANLIFIKKSNFTKAIYGYEEILL